MNIKKRHYFILLGFIVFVGIFISYISSIVSQDKITKEINENVSLLLEKSRVKHGDVKIEYGLNLRFTIPDIEIVSKVSNKTILKVSSVEINSPLLALFFQSFPVNYHFRDITIFADTELKSVLTMKKLQERMTYKNLFGFKTFNQQSKHSLFFENINVIRPEGEFPIQYFKLRNFSWNKLVAYEVRHQISNNKLLPDLYADYILVGEVDLGASIEKKDLRTKAQLKITKLSVGNIIDINSLMNGTISLHIGSNNVFDGHIRTEGEVELDSRFFLIDKQLDLLGMTLKIPVSDFVTLKNILPESQNTNRLLVEGDLKGIGTDNLNPLFKFSFSESIPSSKDDFTFSSALKGTLEGEVLNLSFLSSFSEGNISGELTAPVYSRKTGLLFSLEKNISLNLEVNNIDLKVMSLKKKSFYSLAKDFIRKNEFSEKFKLIDIKINDCLYEKRKLSGGGIFKKEDSTLTTKNFVINYNKGRLLTDLTVTKKYIEGKLAFDKFNFEGLSSITRGGRLPLTGTYTGSLSGVYSKSDQFSHEFEINLSGKDGALTKGQSISSVGSAMAKFSPDLKLSKGANSFSSIKLKGKYTNKKFIAKKIEYDDKNNELKVVGTANILITDIKENNYIGEGSRFLITLIDQKNTLWTKKTSINLPKRVPLRIRRLNQEWVPDLLYTINKIKDAK